MFGIYHHSLFPVDGVIIVVCHKLIEVGHEYGIVDCPVKVHDFWLIFVDELFGVVKPFFCEIIGISLIVISAAIDC